MDVKEVKLKKANDDKLYLGIKSNDNSKITNNIIKGINDEPIVNDECNDSTVQNSFGNDYKVFHLTINHELDKRLDFKIDQQTVSYIPSKMLAYGNIEVMGVDIKGLYDSTSSRVLALGGINSDKIKDDNIQEVLESLNIYGLTGHLGCDINGMEKSKFVFIHLEQLENIDKIKQLYHEFSNNVNVDKDGKKKLANRILNLVNNFMSNDEYNEHPENFKIDNKTLNEIKDEMNKTIGNDKEQNIFQTLGVKFKEASVLYYSGKDTSVGFNDLINGMSKDLNKFSKVISFEEKSLAALPESDNK